ncbi:hypothetical protein DY000_02025697, partial [Brassica cretica]
GVVMGRDEKVSIPHMYIKLVMDFDKVRKFHWGLHSYDFLMSSIEKARKKLGRRVSDSFKGPRCGNWKGVAKFSYEDIIELEDSLIKKDNLFSVISVTGNGDVFLDVDYIRKGEMEDERVDLLLERIRNKYDWSSTDWPVLDPEETKMEEPDCHDRGSEADKSVDHTDVVADEETSSVKVAGKGKRKFLDEGSETRKKKVLCKRSAEKYLTFGPKTKSFIESLIRTSVTSVGDVLSMQMANMERVFTERMGKMEIDVSQLRDAISLTGEENYPSKKEAEEAPLNSKAKQAPPKSKGAQAPPKRKGDQPTPFVSFKYIYKKNLQQVDVLDSRRTALDSLVVHITPSPPAFVSGKRLFLTCLHPGRGDSLHRLHRLITGLIPVMVDLRFFPSSELPPLICHGWFVVLSLRAVLFERLLLHFGFAEGGAPACMLSDSGGSSCFPFVTRVHWAPGVGHVVGGAGIFLYSSSLGLRPVSGRDREADWPRVLRAGNSDAVSTATFDRRIAIDEEDALFSRSRWTRVLHIV